MMRRSLTILAGGAAALTLALPVSAASASAAAVHMATAPKASNSRYVAGLSADMRPGAVPAAAAVAGLHYLDGVFCTSRTSCWAVGGQTGTGGTGMANQMLYWNGTKWRQVSVPDPGGTGADSVSQLFAVRCLAASDCWAVGNRSAGGALLNQALHWNGKKWTVVSTPDPGGNGNGKLSELDDSTCVTSADCWAVGDFGTAAQGATEQRSNQILHWNGRKWSRLRVVNPGGTRTGHVNSLYSVRCSSANDCIAVGDYGTTSASGVLRNEVLSWNGKSWSRVSTPNPGGTKPGGVNEAFALGCGAADSCWAAGTYGSTTSPVKNLDEVLRWNGKKWANATAPNPDGTGTGAANQLFAATCVSSANCWALGISGSTAVGVGVGRNVALHWNGRKWRKVSTPNPGGTAAGDINELESVRCVSSGNCWAVGFVVSEAGVVRNEILHWNGERWVAR